MAERLQKVMAHAGVASRRKSEKMIKQGRVKVNGQLVNTLGSKVSPADCIEVDGKEIELEEKVYYLFHKPEGVITTMDDEFNRRKVSDFFVEVEERIYPVGRLDEDTTGLLLMTNDGQLANQLMHPKYEIKKTYQAWVAGQLDELDIKQLEEGIDLEDGRTAPAQAHCLQLRKNPVQSQMSLSIHEGRKHQVKRMFEAIGHPVLSLHRSEYGPLHLDDLAKGEFRPLTSSELIALRQLGE